MTFSLEYFEKGMGFCGGFQCISQVEWYNEGGNPWEAGKVTDEWRFNDYLGTRGG